ncbi:MAG: NAD(+) synthase, partial [Candidatus Micrarchaeota archaeon]
MTSSEALLLEKKERIARALKDYFKKAGFSKGVVGVSGGLDSAVTLALAVDALGTENVLGVILPSPVTSARDVEDARAVCKKFSVKSCEISLNDALSALEKALNAKELLKLNKIQLGNVAARARMLALHSVAARERALVIGTGDKSEILLGYFTKYGDGGV